MSYLTLADADVLEGTITFPRIGTWHAELLLDTDQAVTGTQALAVDRGQTFQCFVQRGGVEELRASVRVVGGAGGLGKPCKPRDYTRVAVQSILGHVTADGGETVSPTIDPALASKILPRWTTTNESVGFHVALLAQKLGVGWRVLPDGTVWIGAETWPDADVEVTEVGTTPEHGTTVLGSEVIELLPGTKLDDRPVDLVEHVVDGGGLRTSVWFADSETAAAGSVDRGVEALRKLARAALPEMSGALRYRAKVVRQSADLSHLEVTPDPPDERLSAMSEVPIKYGIPGVKASVAPGTIVMVAWEGGDKTRAYVENFETSPTPIKLTIDSALIELAGEGLSTDPINNGVVLGSWVEPLTGKTVGLLGGTSLLVTAKKA